MKKIYTDEFWGEQFPPIPAPDELFVDLYECKTDYETDEEYSFEANPWDMYGWS